MEHIQRVLGSECLGYWIILHFTKRPLARQKVSNFKESRSSAKLTVLSRTNLGKLWEEEQSQHEQAIHHTKWKSTLLLLLEMQQLVDRRC
mmetsp:Transcript_16675/g.24714  ORF Transcript_16675/g.24714 Transcript_16675/m.24714 type:complete len:90 (-) Transcript_16675:99-368(-)